MEQKKVTRDFKVLAEKISPDNVAVMAELIAMKETKILISYLGHHAEKAHLDDVLYISKRGKPRTIKTECYLIVTKMVSRDYRIFRKCQSLEITREEPKPEYGHQSDEEQDYSRADEIAASLNLTENTSLALDYRMSGLSYPEIAKQLSRAVSTVYEYFEKMRARYSAIYG